MHANQVVRGPTTESLELTEKCTCHIKVGIGSFLLSACLLPDLFTCVLFLSDFRFDSIDGHIDLSKIGLGFSACRLFLLFANVLLSPNLRLYSFIRTPLVLPCFLLCLSDFSFRFSTGEIEVMGDKT